MRNFTCFLLCLGWLQSYAQPSITKIQVRDQYLDQPLGNTWLVINNKDSVLTNAYGYCRYAFNQREAITIASLGYLPSQVIMSLEGTSLIVLLKPLNYMANEIQVKGMHHQAKLLGTPGQMTTLVAADFQRNNVTDPQHVFNLAAGVRMEMKYPNAGTRIVMRGYGNQSNTNGAGYKAYYNDVPLTDADGITNLDDIDFSTLGRVEIFKGPASSMYGSDNSGVVSIYGEQAPQGNSIQQRVVAGNNAFLHLNTAVGAANDKSNILLNYGRQQSDGQRLHERSEKNFWNINTTFYNSTRRTVHFFGTYTKSYVQVPGQLDSLGLATRSDTAELAYINNDSHIGQESVRLGFTQEYRFSDLFSNKTTLFLNGQQLDMAVATILTKSNKNSFGARTVFTYTPQIGNVASRFTAGAEAIKTINRQQSYNLNNGVSGSLRTDQEIQPFIYSLFGMADIIMAKTTMLSFGISGHFLSYDVLDMRATGSSAGYVNQSGMKRFKPVATSRMGINHLVSEHVSIYANYSMGFSPPATDQVIITQTGRVNTDIEPELANSFEVGAKGSLFKKTLNFDVMFFNMDVTDRFEPQFFPAATGRPAYTEFVNAGSIDHTGVELSLNYAYLPKIKGFIQLIRPYFSYTFNNCRNANLHSNNNNAPTTKDYSNFKVSGVSPHVLNAGLDIEAGNIFYLNITNMYAERMPVMLDNSVYTGSYNLVNAKAGLRKQFSLKHGNSISFDISGGVNNIFDNRYAQFVSLNVTPVNGLSPKIYTPGPGAFQYYGLRLGYVFK